MTRSKSISSVALVVALLALVASLSGGAIAAAFIDGSDIKKNAIKSKHIKKGAVKSSDVKNNSLKGKDVKNGTLKEDDLAPGLLNEGASAVRVAATSGADFTAARTAAPEQVLFTEGPFTVYAKCFTDRDEASSPPVPQTYAYIYIRTAANGAVFDGQADEKNGGPLATDFLNTDTVETEREIWVAQTGVDDAFFDAEGDGEFGAFATDGTAISGLVALGAKNGTLAGGNGAYGAGDACVFSANVRSN